MDLVQIQGLMSGNVTNSQIVILTNSVRELQEDALIPVQMMLIQEDLHVVLMLTVRQPDIRQSAPVQRPIQVIHSSPAVLSLFVTFVNPTHVVQMHFANLERTKERERIDQCVFAMRDTEGME